MVPSCDSNIGQRAVVILPAQFRPAGDVCLADRHPIYDRRQVSRSGRPTPLRASVPATAMRGRANPPPGREPSETVAFPGLAGRRDRAPGELAPKHLPGPRIPCQVKHGRVGVGTQVELKDRCGHPSASDRSRIHLDDRGRSRAFDQPIENFVPTTTWGTVMPSGSHRVPIRVNPAPCGFLQAILHSAFRRVGGRPSGFDVADTEQIPPLAGIHPQDTEARWSILRSHSCGVQPAISFLIRVQGTCPTRQWPRSTLPP